jgi:hypothetical protein
MVQKNNITKISEAKEGLFARGKNVCSECKRNSIFLYGTICADCMKKKNPSINLGPFRDIT